MIANVQTFHATGTWFKPSDATYIDVVIAGSSKAFDAEGTLLSGRYPAGNIPQEVKVTISGEGGYAIITTHKRGTRIEPQAPGGAGAGMVPGLVNVTIPGTAGGGGAGRMHT